MRIAVSRIQEHHLARLNTERDRVWGFSGHVRERMASKEVTSAEVLGAAKWGRVIEFDNGRGTRRLLVRTPEGVCAVLDLDTSDVVTCFKNHPWDKHATRDNRAYYRGPVSKKILFGGV